MDILPSSSHSLIVQLLDTEYIQEEKQTNKQTNNQTKPNQTNHYSMQ
jgi:hypothetical protein